MPVAWGVVRERSTPLAIVAKLWGVAGSSLFTASWFEGGEVLAVYVMPRALGQLHHRRQRSRVGCCWPPI